MRRFIPLALAATMAVGNLAYAAPEDLEPHLTDVVGDANFLNGQGFEPGVQFSGPMQVPGGDLQTITFESELAAKSVVKLMVHVGLDQPLADTSPDMTFRVTGNLKGCPMMISSSRAAVGGITGYWRFTDAAACGYPAEEESATGTYDIRDGVSVESTDFGFTIILERKTLPKFAADLLKVGSKITEVNAHVRTILVAVTAPVVDELDGSAFEGYKIGD